MFKRSGASTPVAGPDSRALKEHLHKVTEDFSTLGERVAFLESKLLASETIIRDLQSELAVLRGHEHAQHSHAINGAATNIVVPATVVFTKVVTDPPPPPLLSNSNVLPYTRDSPSAAAMGAHASARLAAAADWGSGLNILLNELAVRLRECGEKEDQIACALASVGYQYWGGIAGGETTVQALSALGRCFAGRAAAGRALSSALQTTFAAPLEVELLTPLDRARAAGRASVAAGKEADAAVLRLITLNRGAGPAEIISRARAAALAVQRFERARFDAAMHTNAAEAKRRITLVERCIAASAALQTHSRANAAALAVGGGSSISVNSYSISVNSNSISANSSSISANSHSTSNNNSSNSTSGISTSIDDLASLLSSSPTPSLWEALGRSVADARVAYARSDSWWRRERDALETSLAHAVLAYEFPITAAAGTGTGSTDAAIGAGSGANTNTTCTAVSIIEGLRAGHTASASPAAFENYSSQNASSAGVVGVGLSGGIVTDDASIIGTILKRVTAPFDRMHESVKSAVIAVAARIDADEASIVPVSASPLSDAHLHSVSSNNSISDAQLQLQQRVWLGATWPGVFSPSGGGQVQLGSASTSGCGTDGASGNPPAQAHRQLTQQQQLPNGVLMCGWLFKKSSAAGSWQKRWVFLRGGRLFYVGGNDRFIVGGSSNDTAIAPPKLIGEVVTLNVREVAIPAASSGTLASSSVPSSSSAAATNFATSTNATSISSSSNSSSISSSNSSGGNPPNSPWAADPPSTLASSVSATVAASVRASHSLLSGFVGRNKAKHSNSSSSSNSSAPFEGPDLVASTSTYGSDSNEGSDSARNVVAMDVTHSSSKGELMHSSSSSGSSSDGVTSGMSDGRRVLPSSTGGDTNFNLGSARGGDESLIAAATAAIFAQHSKISSSTSTPVSGLNAPSTSTFGSGHNVTSSSTSGGGVGSGLSAPFTALHAFEVRAPSRVFTFATLTHAQRREWVTVLKQEAEEGLTSSDHRQQHGNAGNSSSSWSTPGGFISSSKYKSMAAASAAIPPLSPLERSVLLSRLQRCSVSFSDSAAAVAEIRRANPTCAECCAPGPEWASLNLGAVFCLNCSGAHRALGAQISRVRSLLLDSIDPLSLGVLLSLGNVVVNGIYEADSEAQPGWTKQRGGVVVPRAEIERFIRAKYEHCAFVDVRLGADAAPVLSAAVAVVGVSSGGASVCASVPLATTAESEGASVLFGDEDSSIRAPLSEAAATPPPSPRLPTSTSAAAPPPSPSPLTRTAQMLAAEQKLVSADASQRLIAYAGRGDVRSVLWCLARGATQIRGRYDGRITDSSLTQLKGLYDDRFTDSSTPSDGVTTSRCIASHSGGDSTSAASLTSATGSSSSNETFSSNTGTALHAAVATGHYFVAALLCHTSGWSGLMEDTPSILSPPSGMSHHPADITKDSHSGSMSSLSGNDTPSAGYTAWETALLALARRHASGGYPVDRAHAGVEVDYESSGTVRIEESDSDAMREGAGMATSSSSSSSSSSTSATVAAAASPCFSSSSPLTVSELSRVLPSLAQILLPSRDRIAGLDLARAMLMPSPTLIFGAMGPAQPANFNFGAMGPNAASPTLRADTSAEEERPPAESPTTLSVEMQGPPAVPPTTVEKQGPDVVGRLTAPMIEGADVVSRKGATATSMLEGSDARSGTNAAGATAVRVDWEGARRMVNASRDSRAAAGSFSRA